MVEYLINIRNCYETSSDTCQNGRFIHKKQDCQMRVDSLGARGKVPQ